MAKCPEIFDYFSVADRVNGDHFHHGAIFLEGDGDDKLVSHFFNFWSKNILCFKLHTMAVGIYSYTFDFDTFNNDTFKSVIFRYSQK